MFYEIPRDWIGETAFILGGGPSLANVDLERFRGYGRFVAVNNAGLTLAPWADVLYWADRRWYEWNRDRLDLFEGSLMISRNSTDRQDVARVGWIRNGYSRRPDMVGGFCSGSNAVNLAALRGASVIILLGFDMRPGNWHDEHKRPPVARYFADRFIPAFEHMAPELEKDGVRVFNATPDSALRCFPFVTI